MVSTESGSVQSIESDDNALDKHVSAIEEIISKNGFTPNTQSDVLENKEYILLHKTKHTPVHLSEQQAYCLKLLAQGKSSKEIAKQLAISPRTVEGYIAKMIEKLGCNTSKELINLYFSR